mgnify:CR=1 FL=1
MTTTDLHTQMDRAFLQAKLAEASGIDDMYQDGRNTAFDTLADAVAQYLDAPEPPQPPLTRAAPDLLAALRRALALFEDIHGFAQPAHRRFRRGIPCATCDWYDEARAAIARAEEE